MSPILKFKHKLDDFNANGAKLNNRRDSSLGSNDPRLRGLGLTKKSKKTFATSPLSKQAQKRFSRLHRIL